MPRAEGVQVFPVGGIGEVTPGTDLAALIARAVAPADPEGPELANGDVVVVTQKIVSKAEGRLVELDHGDPAAKVALVEQESVRVLRRRGDLVISETRHGFICANAGVDLSNVADGTAALLPEDSDRSARRIRAGLQHALGLELGVIVSDTFGRPWRRGVTDVAIGCAGVAAVVDLKGTADAGGRALVATEICVADELASAAELVMGKDRGVPVAVVRGVPAEWLRPASVRSEVIRPPDEDLFADLSPRRRARTRSPHGFRRPDRSRTASRAGSPPAPRRGWSGAAHPGGAGRGRRHLGAGLGHHGAQELVDRRLAPGPDVAHEAPAARRGPDERVDDVVDEDEVPRLLAVPEDRHRPTAHDAVGEDGDHARLAVGILTGPVDVPQGQGAELEGVQLPIGHQVVDDRLLGDAVGRQRLLGCDSRTGRSSAAGSP